MYEGVLCCLWPKHGRRFCSHLLRFHFRGSHLAGSTRLGSIMQGHVCICRLRRYSKQSSFSQGVQRRHLLAWCCRPITRFSGPFQAPTPSSYLSHFLIQTQHHLTSHFRHFFFFIIYTYLCRIKS
ncbi:hypothetical protein Ahy_A06g026213 isoform A [Arachis hypogaea]|uniref:Uncharacterized protein n=1 Tax=Arachis hypogaea TaxID=3818 RepID=A0A445CJT5_ARAHY|nr:hypothetical protein Ahy_A06g026213 isoform A [Arachis hypogaea]